MYVPRSLGSESPQDFSARCLRLEMIVVALGLTSNKREAYMQEAKAAGLSYREAVEHVIRQEMGKAD